MTFGCRKWFLSNVEFEIQYENLKENHSAPSVPRSDSINFRLLNLFSEIIYEIITTLLIFKHCISSIVSKSLTSMYHALAFKCNTCTIHHDSEQEF